MWSWAWGQTFSRLLTFHQWSRAVGSIWKDHSYNRLIWVSSRGLLGSALVQPVPTAIVWVGPIQLWAWVQLIWASVKTAVTKTTVPRPSVEVVSVQLPSNSGPVGLRYREIHRWSPNDCHKNSSGPFEWCEISRKKTALPPPTKTTWLVTNEWLTALID